MSKEDKQNQMEQLFKRGTELVALGQQQLDPGVDLAHPFYQKYNVVIGSNAINIVKEFTLKKWSSEFKNLNSLIFEFFPERSDKLKIKKEIENPRLPIFSVHRDDSFEYEGSLTYLKKHIRETSLWPTLKDIFSAPFEVEYTVGSNKGADRILSNLINRLSGEPSTIIPVNPESWKDIAKGRAGFLKTPIF